MPSEFRCRGCGALFSEVTLPPHERKWEPVDVAPSPVAAEDAYNAGLEAAAKVVQEHLYDDEIPTAIRTLKK